MKVNSIFFLREALLAPEVYPEEAFAEVLSWKNLNRGDSVGMQVVVIPTFISMVPQRTSIVLLPFLAMVRICTIRITEHTVVKPKRAKRMIRTAFLRFVMRVRRKRGIGRMITQRS